MLERRRQHRCQGRWVELLSPRALSGVCSCQGMQGRDASCRVEWKTIGTPLIKRVRVLFLVEQLDYD
jgi:hypothetical protein